MDLYAVNVMDHYKNPRHYGKVLGCSAQRHELNSTCGDEVTLTVLIEDGILKEAGFEGGGCVVSQAGASILLDEAVGMKVDDILKLGMGDVTEMFGVEISAGRRKCAILGLLALKNAIFEFYGRKFETFGDLLV